MTFEQAEQLMQDFHTLFGSKIDQMAIARSRKDVEELYSSGQLKDSIKQDAISKGTGIQGILESKDLYEAFEKKYANDNTMMGDLARIISHYALKTIGEILNEGMVMEVDITIQLLDKDAQVPVYAHYTDGGADVFAKHDFTVLPNEKVLHGLGIAIVLPEGTILWGVPKSGISHNLDIQITNSPGLIDSDYRDELMVSLLNYGKAPITFKKGDKLAQLVLMPYFKGRYKITKEDVKKIGNDRGGGYGSTGK